MDAKTRTSVSKFLSFVLRHRPHAIGLTLDEAGWVDVDVLLEACAKHGRALTRAELDEVVATNDKRRFAFSDDGRRIRASQGHSIDVELGYEPAEPPDALFHGTVRRLLRSIRAAGLQRMDRHHVHLSPDEATARAVGSRRGKPIVLRVDARGMRTAGHVFYRTPNGVWLTDEVPRGFIVSGLERRVTLVAYDPTWPATFDELGRRLGAALGPLASRIEHVGSTSVPGLCAKPIIDIDVVIASSDLLTDVIDRLAALGYHHEGDKGIAGREAFEPPDEAPAHHLYVCVEGSKPLDDHLAFRDLLRASPQTAQAYARLKRRLAAEHAADIDAYQDGKRAFIDGMVTAPRP